VIRAATTCLSHVPDLVEHGSTPRRKIAADPTWGSQIRATLRSYGEAVAYPPNQVFIGNLAPDDLAGLARPWYATRPVAVQAVAAQRSGPLGEIIEQEDLYALLAAADVMEPPLVTLTAAAAEDARARLATHPLLRRLKPSRVEARDDASLEHLLERGAALPLRSGETLVGVCTRDERAGGRDDPNLKAEHLLENLAAKASGALALLALLDRAGIEAAAVEYVISCGEEAVGDRFQRGGGGMAKAIAEMCRCASASGMDVKNFCAGPASALVTAGALVQAGLYSNVVVVAGGSLSKLGMEFEAFLAQGRPILEDTLASIAFLVTADDGASPLLRLERGAVGLATVGASSSMGPVYRSLVVEPLEMLGLTIPEVDRFASELHNPEIMEPSGSGDVVAKNYRAIAATAVRAGHLRREEMEALIARVGMPGFAPDQGHVPSGVAYIGHAAAAMSRGDLQRCMILSKASLFLGRITELFDGVSFLLERNPGLTRR
jgi:betaine reductase